MVEDSAEAVNFTFAAIADPDPAGHTGPTQGGGERLVTELAEPFDVSLLAVMKVLEDAGLISREKAGKVSRCRLNTNPLQNATEWINPHEIEHSQTQRRILCQYTKSLNIR